MPVKLVLRIRNFVKMNGNLLLENFLHPANASENIGLLQFFSRFFWQLHCRIQMFFGHTVFLKLRIGQFSDTQNPPMVLAECQKIFDVSCIRGRIFVSLEKILIFGGIFLATHTIQTIPKSSGCGTELYFKNTNFLTKIKKCLLC